MTFSNGLSSDYGGFLGCILPFCIIFILTAYEICHKYHKCRSRKAAYFLMRLCASCYAARQINLAGSITIFTEFTWVHTAVFNKYIAKIRRIFKTYLICYLVDFFTC